jgi:hypothetical protein
MLHEPAQGQQVKPQLPGVKLSIEPHHYVTTPMKVVSGFRLLRVTPASVSANFACQIDQEAQIRADQGFLHGDQLLQSAGDAGEGRVQLAAHALNRNDNYQRNTCSDQTVLNRRGARFIFDERNKCTHVLTSVGWWCVADNAMVFSVC